ncbi:MAG: AlkA N-terminal domain-containing protein [Halioglobus sp.]|nr:AlkA N-terminal domain-containing protein [Halioglobus sp.]
MTNTPDSIARQGLPSRDICRRARLSRDPRFDGEFFLAVSTTGIYCRPVCPARAPAERNVTYFGSAEQAAQAGFRPCLRCRPESAPGSSAWRGTSVTVTRALRLIEDGALSSGSLPQLADRLGVGERYLRKLFQRELGISPGALALNRRLLFAKQLLAETAMPVTEVAFASGFGSVRRFNDAVRKHFRLPPSRLRRGSTRTGATQTIELLLRYRAPYDWQGVAAFFARHAVDGVERVDDSGYYRHLRVDGYAGDIHVRPAGKEHALRLGVQLQDPRMLQPVVARVRRMFDLDANPASIGEALGSGPLAALLRRSPGVRAPGYGDLFEAALRAVIGQQISTGAARGILGRLSAATSNSTQAAQFPTPAGVLALPDSDLPMPGRRRETVRALCALFSRQEGCVTLDDIAALPGIGPWSEAMIAMRGLGDPDSLPLTDLGIVNAWRALPGDNDIKSTAQQWRPWRSYAANLLWRSLGG